MRFVIFTHSLVSDWNHGNAHFLRGVATELVDLGHDLRILEPVDGWSRQNLIATHGTESIAGFERTYPHLRSSLYDSALINLDRALEGADVVLVHEWNPPQLVAGIGEHHGRNGTYVLLFHDTHHRSVTDPQSIRSYDLSNYDGVLAYGGIIRDLYRRNQWARDAWTWHEEADT